MTTSPVSFKLYNQYDLNAVTKQIKDTASPLSNRALQVAKFVGQAVANFFIGAANLAVLAANFIASSLRGRAQVQPQTAPVVPIAPAEADVAAAPAAAPLVVSHVVLEPPAPLAILRVIVDEPVVVLAPIESPETLVADFFTMVEETSAAAPAEEKAPVAEAAVPAATTSRRALWVAASAVASATAAAVAFNYLNRANAVLGFPFCPVQAFVNGTRV